MSIRTIRDSESLDTAWEELVFTEARLLGDSNAQEFAEPIAALLTRLEQVRGGQLGVWREQVTAQAAVDAQDYRLDNWVRGFDLVLLGVVGQNAKAPRYRRYFSVPPSRIIRMGLETELARVRPWVDSLQTEPEPELQAQGAQLKLIVVDAEKALSHRTRAGTARVDHRVRNITSLVDDINGARSSLYGALMQKATEMRLPRDWPNQFFRHIERTARAQSSQPEAASPASPPLPAPQQTSAAKSVES